MSNKKNRTGAVRKKGLGKAVGSGGPGRQALEGRGPTPKAEDREYHAAYKAKKARERYEAAKEKVATMDPKVRRRRTLLTAGIVVLVLGAATAYVAVYDWPHFAVDGWNWVQDINGAIPDLPGM